MRAKRATILSCSWTSLFEAGAGWIGKLRWERSLGHGFPLGESFTAADVKDQWHKITDFADATHPAHGEEAITSFIQAQMGVEKSI